MTLSEPCLRAAVSRYEWRRPWSAREAEVFRRDLARTDQRLHRDLASEDGRLAVQRDAERAAALAEPVRRIAQPRRTAPGVDYHRLSAEEHLWVFDELIAPSYLKSSAAMIRGPCTYWASRSGEAGAAAADRRARPHGPGGAA